LNLKKSKKKVYDLVARVSDLGDGLARFPDHLVDCVPVRDVFVLCLGLRAGVDSEHGAIDSSQPVWPVGPVRVIPTQGGQEMLVKLGATRLRILTSSYPTEER
jgi:hypothetical protein